MTEETQDQPKLEVGSQKPPLPVLPASYYNQEPPEPLKEGARQAQWDALGNLVGSSV